jgi:predicted membrane-bound mannosyltransferase
MKPMHRKSSIPARFYWLAVLLLGLLTVPRLVMPGEKPLMHDESMFAWYAFRHYQKLEKKLEREIRIRDNESLKKGLYSLKASTNASTNALRDRDQALRKVEGLKQEFPGPAAFYDITISESVDPDHQSGVLLSVDVEVQKELARWTNPSVPGGYTHLPILHGPFMILGVGYTFQLMGDSIASARIFIAICSMIALAACLGLWPSRYRWWFASILFTSPILLYYSRFLRNEMVFCMIMMIGLLGISRALSRRKSSPLWAIVGMTGMLMMLAVKENALFVYASGITFGGVWLIVRLFWKRPVRSWQPLLTRQKTTKPETRESLTRLTSDTSYAHPSFEIIIGESDSGPPAVQPRIESEQPSGPSGPVKNSVRIGLNLVGWILGTLVGILLLAMIYDTTATSSVDGWFANMKRSWDYWLGQHKEHRIEGPLHYHLPILLTYELPVIALLYVGLLFDAMLRPARARFYGLSLLTGFTLWMAWVRIADHATPAWLIYIVLLLIVYLAIIFILRLIFKSVRPGIMMVINLFVWCLVPFYILYSWDGLPRDLAALGSRINSGTPWWITALTLILIVAGGTLVTMACRHLKGWRKPVLLVGILTPLAILIILMFLKEQPGLLVKVSAFLHIEPSGSMLVLGLMFTPLLSYSIIALKEHRTLAAWTGWLAACSLFQYSSAGEKVPWLAVHMILPLYLALGWIWSPLLRRFTRWGRFVVFAVLILINLFALRTDYHLIHDRAADPRERLVYNHTPPAFDRACKNILRKWEHHQDQIPLSSRRVILVEETGWPGYWYFRHCAPVGHHENILKVAPGTDLIISRQVYIDSILEKYRFKSHNLLDMRQHWFGHPPRGKFTRRLEAYFDYWWNREVWNETGNFPIVMIEPEEEI